MADIPGGEIAFAYATIVEYDNAYVGPCITNSIGITHHGDGITDIKPNLNP